MCCERGTGRNDVDVFALDLLNPDGRLARFLCVLEAEDFGGSWRQFASEVLYFLIKGYIPKKLSCL